MPLRHFLIAAAMACTFSMTPGAAHADISSEDFIREASVSSEFEIQSGKLALEKSQNKHIQNFAQRMVDDHTRAARQMRQALGASPLRIEPETRLDDKHQRIMRRLEELSTDAFNQEYVRVQVDAHKEAVELFKDYKEEGDDDALRNFAVQTLPTLEQHLTHVKKLEDDMHSR